MHFDGRRDDSGRYYMITTNISKGGNFIVHTTDGGKSFNNIADMNTRYLSTECAGGFTGTMIALYATDPEEKSSGVFDFFEYRTSY